MGICWLNAPFSGALGNGNAVYGQNGVDLGHCSQILVFASIGGTRKGVHFSGCFSQLLVIFGPTNTAEQGKKHNDKSTLSYPLTWECFGPGTLFSPIFGILGGRKTAQEKNKFLGTEVPRNFSDQCSLDFAYFLCLFSGRRSKSSQELCSWELFFFLF